MKNKQGQALCNILAVCSILVLEALFFRNILFSDALLGDLGDARLNTLLVEHWFRFFGGKESWHTLSMFYPVQHTISYTDMLFAFAVPYSVLRAFGVGMYTANKIVLVLFHLTGSISLFCLLKKKCKVDFSWSMIGVAVFSYSAAYSVRAGHTQLFAISLVPVLLWFLFGFFENFSERRKRVRYGFFSVTSYVVLMYTSWYVAFFTMLFLLTYVIIFGIITRYNSNRKQNFLLEYIRGNLWEIFFYIIYGGLVSIPFFAMYLPTSRMFGARTWDDVTSMLPELIDYINLMPGNLCFGEWISRFRLSERAGLVYGELCVGFSPVVLLLLCIILYRYHKRHLQQKVQVGQQEEGVSDVFYSLIITVFVSFLLILQSSGVSLWWFLWKLVPGASSIRAVVRYNFFLTLPVAIIIAVAGHAYMEKAAWKNSVKRIALVICFSMILLSNVSKTGVYSDMKQKDMENRVKQVAQMPEGCQVLFIYDSDASTPQATFDYQLLAWEIACRYDVKTINGYSGQFPLGWGLQEVVGADYLDQVRAWVQRYNLTNVYGYDVETNTWKALEEL